jgi:hypothetical protein
LARERALYATFGGDLRFGLATGGVELTDSGYARIGGQMADPANSAIQNATTLRFPPLAADAERQIDQVLIFDQEDRLLVSAPVDKIPVIPRLQITFAPGDIAAALQTV